MTVNVQDEANSVCSHGLFVARGGRVETMRAVTERHGGDNSCLQAAAWLPGRGH